MNDLWIFSLSSLSWEKITSVNEPEPRYRFGYASYIEGSKEYFAIFGGSVISGEDNNLYM